MVGDNDLVIATDKVLFFQPESIGISDFSIKTYIVGTHSLTKASLISNEYPQHISLWRNKRKIPDTPSYL